MGDVLIDEGSWVQLHRELEKQRLNAEQVNKFMQQHQGKKFKVWPYQMVNFSCRSFKYFSFLFTIYFNVCSILAFNYNRLKVYSVFFVCFVLGERCACLARASIMVQ